MKETQLKECSFCKKMITPDEDSVVCPECGAPSHRSCYEANGQCAFAQQHGEGFVYVNPHQEKESQSERQCPKCHALNTPQALFCERCGTSLGAMQQQAPPPLFSASSTVPPQQPPLQAELDGISLTDWADFIGDSSPSYLQTFATMKQNNSKISFCWISLIFPPIYFFYRKMWGWAIGTFLFFTLLNIPYLLQTAQLVGIALPDIFSNVPLAQLNFIASLLHWITSIFFVLFSIDLYRRFAIRKITKIKSTTTDFSTLRAKLKKQGGTSGLNIFILFILSFAVQILIFYWIDPSFFERLFEFYSLNRFI